MNLAQSRNGARRANAQPDTEVIADAPVIALTPPGPMPSTALESSRTRGSSDFAPPPVLTSTTTLLYNLDDTNANKFGSLGRSLSRTGQLYRDTKTASGLLQVVLGSEPEMRPIRKPEDLSALLADRVVLIVVQGGVRKGRTIPAAELKLLPKSEIFLQEFAPLDRIIVEPAFFPGNFHLTEPGYHDGGPGQRVYFAGEPALIRRSRESIDRFLAAMPFASEADRTNAVAAALTVILRNHFPGHRPVFAVTANRSHSGKGTIVAFATGATKIAIVHYETADWAFRRNFLDPIRSVPGLGVLNIDNVHPGVNGAPIRSAFLEAFVHDPRPALGASGRGSARTIDNHLVVFTTGNRTQFSEDMMNRAVSIRLEAKGDLSSRTPAIGNPKHEYLPQHRDEIRAELLGMIQSWVVAGQPRFKGVHHNCNAWAELIGGILQHAGYEHFLENQLERKTADDPITEALGRLGSESPDQWHTATTWSGHIAALGLTKTLISVNNRDSTDGRARATGIVLTDKPDVPLAFVSEDEKLTLCVRRARKRFDSGKPETRYKFEVLHREPIPFSEE